MWWGLQLQGEWSEIAISDQQEMRTSWCKPQKRRAHSPATSAVTTHVAVFEQHLPEAVFWTLVMLWKSNLHAHWPVWLHSSRCVPWSRTVVSLLKYTQSHSASTTQAWRMNVILRNEGHKKMLHAEVTWADPVAYTGVKGHETPLDWVVKSISALHATVCTWMW